MTVIRELVDRFVHEEPGTDFYVADPDALVAALEDLLGRTGAQIGLDLARMSFCDLCLAKDPTGLYCAHCRRELAR